MTFFNSAALRLGLGLCLAAGVTAIAGCGTGKAGEETLARVKELGSRMDSLAESQRRETELNVQLRSALRNQEEMAANFSKLQDNLAMLNVRMEELNAKTQLLGQKLTGGGADESAQAARAATLESEVRAANLRLEKLSERMKAVSAEIAAALGKREGQTPEAPGGQTSASSKQEPGDLYQRAYQAHLSGRFEEAAEGFSAYLSLYPQTELSDNAAYWLGEAKLANGEMEGASAAFEQMALAFPGSNKAPAALLKSAEISAKLGDAAGAERKFNAIISKYPAAPEAQKAKGRLPEAAR